MWGVGRTKKMKASRNECSCEVPARFALIAVRRAVFILVIVGFCSGSLRAQKSTGPAAGTLIVDGGGATESVVRRFVELAGGHRAQIVVFATGPSAIRFGYRNIILNPDWPRDRKEWSQYEEYLKRWLSVDLVKVLHTRDRAVANSEAFVAPLKSATGVYLIAGNAGRYADAYLGTRTQTELIAVLARGGVIFGSSAGAIIQGSFVVRGRPDKPLMIAPGRTTGFSFLTNVAINPHLTSAQRDAELVNVVDANPNILGIGIEDDAALLVRQNTFEVIGTGKVAIYDNVRRDGSWYYWLNPGYQFDLSTWTVIKSNSPGTFYSRSGVRIVFIVIPLLWVTAALWCIGSVKGRPTRRCSRPLKSAAAERQTVMPSEYKSMCKMRRGKVAFRVPQKRRQQRWTSFILQEL